LVLSFPEKRWLKITVRRALPPIGPIAARFSVNIEDSQIGHSNRRTLNL
jgi:hypothetical protein